MRMQDICEYLGAWNQRLLAPYAPPLAEPYARAGVAAFVKAVEAGRISLRSVSRCPCGSGQLLRLSAHDRFGLDFSTLLCCECGLALTDPMLEDAGMAYYYEELYHKMTFNRESFAADAALFGKRQGKAVWDRLHPHLEKRKKLAVLEIGAGTGNVLRELREEAAKHDARADCFGTEYNTQCLSLIAAQGVTAIRGGVAEVRERCKDMAFDVIVLSHVLEHIPDIDPFLQSLHALCAEHTKIYIEVPGILSLPGTKNYGHDYLQYVTHAHVAHYCLAALRHHVCRNGFAMLSGDEIAHGVFAPGAGAARKEPLAAVDVLFYLKGLEARRHADRATAAELADLRRQVAAYAQAQKELVAAVNRLTRR